jgi:cell division protein FtsB
MKWAIAFGACLLLFGVAGDEHGLRAVFQARRDAEQLTAQIAALRAENAALRRQAEALRSDPAAIESAARETLGFIRPGEIVVLPIVRP